MIIQRLVNLREKYDWNQTDVANKLNIPRSTYNAYENGINEMDNKMLVKVAKLYGVSTDYLLGHDYINNNNYTMPVDINNIKDAISFLENIICLMENKTDEEIIRYAQSIFYLSKNL